MRIVIVGIGKVGRALAEHLSREGHDVAVIDNRPGMAERLAEELDVLGIEGNGAAYTVQQRPGPVRRISSLPLPARMRSI